MNPALCILGGCNGAGKTTLARELLPRLGLMRFLNADEMVRIGLEASRVATEKMLDYYRRMGIQVTPEMTLAPEKPKRTRRKAQ